MRAVDAEQSISGGLTILLNAEEIDSHAIFFPQCPYNLLILDSI